MVLRLDGSICWLVVVFSASLACGDGGQDSAGVTTDDSADTETGTGDGEPEPEPEDHCEDVDCSGHGTCVDNGSYANCECDPGYIDVDLECIPCVPVSGQHDIDIPMVTLSGEMSVAGEVLGDDLSARLTLEGRGPDTVALGSMNDTPYTIDLIPGTYDVSYASTTDAIGIPWNYGTTFVSDVEVLESGQLDIDVPVITVSGQLSINGVEPATEVGARLRLDNKDAGGSLTLPESNTYTVSLIPGTYDIDYDNISAPEGVPKNGNALLAEAVEVLADGTLDIDIPSVTVSGTRLIGGQAILAPLGGALTFKDAALGAVGLNGLSSTDYSVELLPGIYDIRYFAAEIVAGMPRNLDGSVAERVPLLESTTLDIDVPVITVTGTKTVAGQVVIADHAGELRFVSRTSNDWLFIDDLGTPDYSVIMMPGTYDVFYTMESLVDGIPHNISAVVAEDVVLLDSTSLDIDIPMITISGNMTVNGQPFVGAAGAKLRLSNPSSGDSVFLGPLTDGGYSLEIVPGTYDVVYTLEYPIDGVPNNGAVLQTDVELLESGQLDIDVPMITLTGNVTINGQPAPVSESQVRINGSPLSTLGSPYSAELVPGTYRLTYGSFDDVEGTPQNNYAVLGCIEIQ